MNLKVTWATVLAVALATLAAPAFADGPRRGHGHRDHDRREYRHDYRREVRHDRRDHRYDRRHDRHYRAPVRVVHHHAPPRHAGPPRWARGGYVHHYHQPVYVVHDYYGYGLRHPPHGHHWVRDDYGRYLLVAVATGLIVDMILR